MRPKTARVLLLHGLVGWAFCGGVMGIGLALLPERAALVLHAALAPLGFALVSLVYFRRFAYTGPLATAGVFLLVVVGLDAGIVAPFLEGSFAMFGSVLGTWLPFALIFVATWVTGRAVRGSGRSQVSRVSIR